MREQADPAPLAMAGLLRKTAPVAIVARRLRHSFRDGPIASNRKPQESFGNFDGLVLPCIASTLRTFGEVVCSVLANFVRSESRARVGSRISALITAGSSVPASDSEKPR